jgi:leader peptidase (prepilin peptidase)/N-methyltransferase
VDLLFRTRCRHFSAKHSVSVTSGGGKGRDVSTIDGVGARVVTTAERVERAWAGAHPVSRRAVVAACVTAPALGTAAPGGLAVGLGVAATGQLLALAALVDVHEHKLPNRLLTTALLATAVAVAAASDPSVALAGLVGLFAAGVPMLLVRLSRGIGMGDVKMAAVVGASTGTVSLVAAPTAIAVAALAGSAYGLLARRRRIAMGPALWVGWAVALGAATAGWL